jgi:23S rRNA (guanine745-N1)-methyltransferase
MTITGFDKLLCPLDGDPLQRDDASWRCSAGHSFDIARQGYVNLLPVQNKRSRDPGDSREMVAARARFLEAGFYKPLATAVARAALAGLPADAAVSLLDAGCGEGYYLRQVAEAAGLRQSLAMLGLDISKWAVLAAARTDPRPTWVVGSNARLPVPAQSMDRVLCLFGFPVYPEFSRVLKPGGELLLADPGPAHLRELREIIYPKLKPTTSEAAAVPEGFTRVAVESVSYPMLLADAATIANLLAMTPHLYRAGAAGKEKLLARSRLAVTVDVRLTRLRRMA